MIVKSLKALWEKWKEKKHGQWLILVLLLALSGALLLTDFNLSGGQTAMEKRIAQVLSAMEGCGQVEISIYYGPENTNVWGEKTENTTPIGAVVVAEGANKVEVRLMLMRAVQTLLGLDQQSVQVYPMGERPRN
jgi:hypothetical protein